MPKYINKLLRYTLYLLLIPIHSQAGLLESGFTAKYELSLGSMYVGIATRKLVADKQKLVFTSIAEPKGLASLFVSDIISETSTMLLKDRLIQPINYRYQQSGGDKKIDDQVTFDSKDKLIRLSHNKQQFPLTQHDYDVLNFQIALMLELQKNNNNFSFNVASYKKFYRYDVNIMEEELIETPAGEFKVIKINSIHPQSGRRFVFWCAPKLDFLPVKVEYTKKKDSSVSELVLQSITM